MMSQPAASSPPEGGAPEPGGRGSGAGELAPEVMEIIAHHEEQLRQLVSRTKNTKHRIELLARAGLDAASEREMKMTLADVERKIELLYDYVKTFKIEHEITNAYGLDDVKHELEQLVVKYSNPTPRGLDSMILLITRRIEMLKQLYNEVLERRAYEAGRELSELWEATIEAEKKILRDLRGEQNAREEGEDKTSA